MPEDIINGSDGRLEARYAPAPVPNAPKGLILHPLSPPANQFDFSFLAPCPSSGLIIRGGRDEMVPASAVTKLVTKLSQQKDIRIDHQVVPDASHFFVKRTDDLGAYVDRYLEGAAIKAAPPPPPPTEEDEVAAAAD